MDKSGSKGPVHELPPVKRIQGALVSYGREAVNLQYTDKADNLQQLTMSMGDALYLLSLLKSMQLNLDFPFPDDPRNPNAIPVKPSERKQG